VPALAAIPTLDWPEVLLRVAPAATRIAAQIVTGIGFLGAGAIIRQGLSIRGLTTAATLWVVAAIGLATGAGYYSAAVITTRVALAALWPLRAIAYRMVRRYRGDTGTLLVQLPAGESSA
jgi:putative Mg2+ transporter-C (MgtC) family protein